MREWIARALGSLGDQRAIEPLGELANDPSGAVREWSARAVRSIRRDRGTDTDAKQPDHSLGLLLGPADPMRTLETASRRIGR